MSSSPLAAGIRHLRGKLAAQQRKEESDEQLLHAFTIRRDENAFAVLVRRHGPMVLHVCRRLLGHEQDAEDAFQAVFLVLARSAESLRNKASLVSFLHGTAYRTAMKAKQSAARRRKHESQTLARPATDPADELSWREVRALLDEEIDRLPDTYRGVFVLCHLENLSRADAAQRLGLKERTVLSRLAEARKRLSQRLSRRGVELTAVLAATALATPPASALPARLMAKTMKAVLAAASGKELASVVSAAVVELVQGATSAMIGSKAKIATVLLLTASMLAGAGVCILASPQRPQEQPLRALQAGEQNAEALAAKATDKPQPRTLGQEPRESVQVRGRILDPDGKPVAGAKVYLLYFTPKELPIFFTPKQLPIPIRAVSDKEGRFHFSVAHKEFDQSSSTRPWDEAMVVATAKGYGLGLPAIQPGRGPRPMDWKLRLSKDVPITGRIIDLQGKPIAGVSVGVHGLYWSAKEDLTGLISDLKEKKEGYPALGAHLSEMGGEGMGRDLGKFFPPVKTGADGRFRLEGIGRERVAVLRLQGAGIAASELFAMTRPSDTIRVGCWRRGELAQQMTFCGSTFEHIAAPCQPIVGVVRDKDTGKLLAGAVIRSYGAWRRNLDGFRFKPGVTETLTYLSAVTDKEGRYRLEGIPKGEGNEIRAEGPQGEPYVMSVVSVPQGIGLDPITVDFQLKRGVWVHGKVTDKATGEPVYSAIRCGVFDDNPYRKEARGLHFEHALWNHAGDGTFRFVTLPGRGVIAAQAVPPRYRSYLFKVGADRIEGLDRHLQLRLNMEPYHTIVEIDPDKDAKDVRCDIVLDPGPSLGGTVLGPDGQPLAGAKAGGLGAGGDRQYEPLRTAKFTVRALAPNETRLLQFAHAEKHLAGSLVVRGDAKGPLTTTLKPAGTLKGRFVTPTGKPWAGVAVTCDANEPITDAFMTPKLDPTIGTFPQVRTGKDGSFRIADLPPGLKYRIRLFTDFKGVPYVLPPDGPAGSGVTVGEGETRELGDVTVQGFE